jgi:hypothetical protein
MIVEMPTAMTWAIKTFLNWESLIERLFLNDFMKRNMEDISYPPLTLGIVGLGMRKGAL